jgi:hypothetical protein
VACGPPSPRPDRRWIRQDSEQFGEATAALRDSVDPDALEIQEKPVRPRKSDIQVSRLSLVWRPYLVGSDGIASPA